MTLTGFDAGAWRMLCSAATGDRRKREPPVAGSRSHAAAGIVERQMCQPGRSLRLFPGGIGPDRCHSGRPAAIAVKKSGGRCNTFRPAYPARLSWPCSTRNVDSATRAVCWTCTRDVYGISPNQGHSRELYFSGPASHARNNSALINCTPGRRGGFRQIHADQGEHRNRRPCSCP
jgi:hypothetical protein